MAARSHEGKPIRGNSPAASVLHRNFVPDALSNSGHPIDRGTRSFFESRFGHDFSHVRVHTDPVASASAESLNAQAYTVNRHILFGAGEYSPGTSKGRALLAHELTHVLQQTGGSGGSISEAQAEHEADRNSARLAAGRSFAGASPVRAGQVQCQKDKEKKEKEKKKLVESEVKLERTGKEPGKTGDPVKDSFKVEAELTVPMPGGGVSFGAISFLDELKLSGEGSFLGDPLGAEEWKSKIALTMMKLELSNLKNKEDAITRGKVSFGTTLTATGGPTLKFDPYDVTGSLGVQLQSKFSATTANIIPSKYGKLTLGTSLSATGSVTQPLDEGVAKPKIEGKAGVSASYESRETSHPAATIGGLLGDKAKFTAGLEGEAGGSYVPELEGATAGATPTPATSTGKFGGGLSIGLAGKRKKTEIFLKLKLSGNANINHQAGIVTTESKTTFEGFGGLTTGVKF